ncbi:MAG: hypothetical protein CR982_06815 [Candidatus Cloacimonadota bacterium]|nr:MAG: hypothetical protein CR982_06815 [Candidatus Cloacimonadota bacterium]PIE77805.1 MAG: hypothetical protein CSA15_10950 [Candidatus Delongbacteria bacterium]
MLRFILLIIFSFSFLYGNSSKYFFKYLNINPKRGRVIADSLYRNSISKDERVESLRYISISYYYLNRSDSALWYVEKAEQEIYKGEHSPNNLFTQGKIYNLKGAIFEEMSFYDRSMTSYLKAMSIFKNLNKENELFSVYKHIANLYRIKGDYKNSIDYYNKGVPLIGDNKRREASLLSDLAISYLNLGDFTKGLESCNKAISIYTELKDDDGRNLSKIIKGNLFLAQEKLDQSEKIFREVILESIKSGNKLNLKDGYNNLGIVLIKLGKYDESIKYLYKSANLEKESGNWGGYCQSYINIAQLNYTLLNFDKSSKIVDRFIDDVYLDNFPLLKLKFLYLKGKLLIVDKRIKESEKYFDKAISLKDSIANIHNLSQLNNLKDRYEKLEIEREEENKIRDSYIFRDNREFEDIIKYLIIALICISSVLVIAIFLKIRR